MQFINDAHAYITYIVYKYLAKMHEEVISSYCYLIENAFVFIMFYLPIMFTVTGINQEH
jgi:hypothetical protein